MNFYNINKFLNPIENFRIVYYHTISPQKQDYHFGNISLSNFKKQLDFFGSKYNVISLSEAIDRLENGGSIKNCLSITTDDGFAENFNFVAPILLKKKFKATFFLIEDCIDNKAMMWRNKLQYLLNNKPIALPSIISSASKKFNLDLISRGEFFFEWVNRAWPMHSKGQISDFFWESTNQIPIDHFLQENTPYMSTNQIKTLLEMGFEIGVHTKSHPFCDKLSYSELYDEVIGSSKSLSSKFGRKVDLVSYPFGIRPKKAFEEKLVQENQIRCLLGIHNNMNNSNNRYKWERDGQESKFLIESWLKYTLLPFFERGKLFPKN